MTARRKRPTHFITKYGREVHTHSTDKLGCWGSLCGIYTLPGDNYAHHGPATCERCIAVEAKQHESAA